MRGGFPEKKIMRKTDEGNLVLEKEWQEPEAGVNTV